MGSSSSKNVEILPISSLENPNIYDFLAYHILYKPNEYIFPPSTDSDTDFRDESEYSDSFASDFDIAEDFKIRHRIENQLLTLNLSLLRMCVNVREHRKYSEATLHDDLKNNYRLIKFLGSKFKNLIQDIDLGPKDYMIDFDNYGIVYDDIETNLRMCPIFKKLEIRKGNVGAIVHCTNINGIIVYLSGAIEIDVKKSKSKLKIKARINLDMVAFDSTKLL